MFKSIRKEVEKVMLPFMVAVACLTTDDKEKHKAILLSAVELHDKMCEDK